MLAKRVIEALFELPHGFLEFANRHPKCRFYADPEADPDNEGYDVIVAEADSKGDLGQAFLDPLILKFGFDVGGQPHDAGTEDEPKWTGHFYRSTAKEDILAFAEEGQWGFMLTKSRYSLNVVFRHFTIAQGLGLGKLCWVTHAGKFLKPNSPDVVRLRKVIPEKVLATAFETLSERGLNTHLDVHSALIKMIGNDDGGEEEDDVGEPDDWP